MAGNKADEKAKTEAPKTAAKAAPAQKFVHILTLGHGAATRNVQLITDSPRLRRSLRNSSRASVPVVPT